MRPVGAPGGEGLHPGRFKDQYAEVQCDPGAAAEAARLRRGLRGRCVPGPAGPVRRAEAGGGLDYFRPTWKGLGLQVGERHGAVLSTHMSWGPSNQLYSRHLYALINSLMSLNCWVVLTEGAINELLFWQGLPRLKFEGLIWPPASGVAIRMASDANDIGWGGTLYKVPPEYAKEYFS